MSIGFGLLSICILMGLHQDTIQFGAAQREMWNALAVHAGVPWWCVGVAACAAWVSRYSGQTEIAIRARLQPSGRVVEHTFHAEVDSSLGTWVRSCAAGIASDPAIDGLQMEVGELLAASVRQSDADPADGRITVSFAYRPGRLTVSVRHDLSSVAVSDAPCFVRHLATLAIDGLARPGIPLWQLSMLDEEEREIQTASQDLAPHASRSIPEAFEERVAQHPNAPALTCDGVTLTYAQVNARSNKLARHLVGCGLPIEGTVGVCMSAPLDAAVAFIGILKAGGAFLALDPDEPDERLRHIIRVGRVRRILTTSALAGRIAAGDFTAICVDRVRDLIDGESGANLPLVLHADNAAYVTFTSGSTGKPKGIVGPHRTVSGVASWATPMRADEVCCLNTSFSFGASVLGLFFPLLAGSPSVLVRVDEARDLQRLVSIWESSHVTRIVLVPPQLQQLLALGRSTTSRLSRVTTVALAGAPLAAEMVGPFFEAFPQAKLINAYGSMEIGTMATRTEINREAGRAYRSSVGRPVGNTSVYVLDRHLNPLPRGVLGEIYVQTADMSRGYVDSAALTAERYIANPLGARPSSRLYRTGDWGRFLLDGSLELVGRVDHQVKVRGIRIQLEEVEAALRRHQDVRESAVTAAAIGGHARLVAYVVPHEGRSLRPHTLRHHVRSILPAHMVPSTYVLLDTMPLMPNGKIDRNALPPPSAARPTLETPYVGPRTRVEAALADIWARACGLDSVGINDHFLEIGGDSMSAAVVVADIADELSVDVPVAAVFESPTVALLASALARDMSGTAIVVAGSAPQNPVGVVTTS